MTPRSTCFFISPYRIPPKKTIEFSHLEVSRAHHPAPGARPTSPWASPQPPRSARSTPPRQRGRWTSWKNFNGERWMDRGCFEVDGFFTGDLRGNNSCCDWDLVTMDREEKSCFFSVSTMFFNHERWEWICWDGYRVPANLSLLPIQWHTGSRARHAETYNMEKRGNVLI